MTIIVLINLLIAMMSDTYCRIQEQVKCFYLNDNILHQMFSPTSSGSLVWRSWSGTCREPTWLHLLSTSSPPGWCCSGAWPWCSMAETWFFLWFFSGRGTLRSGQNGRRRRWGSGERCERRSCQRLLGWGGLLKQKMIKLYVDRFVVEENTTKKKKQKKPRVIHALGNIKWGFVPANVRKDWNLSSVPINVRQVEACSDVLCLIKSLLQGQTKVDIKNI